MTVKRFMAIHTFHSEKTREDLWSGIAEDTSTQKDWAKHWTFDKCKCIATWSGQDDDFFFCHWLADTEDEIHNAIKENGLDQFVFTACYEAHNYIDTACLSDERAFQIKKTAEA